MKREQFQRKIARLNTNIMFLCCWYRVDNNYELRPKQSIRNIKLALDVAINRQTNSYVILIIVFFDKKLILSIFKTLVVIIIIWKFVKIFSV